MNSQVNLDKVSPPNLSTIILRPRLFKRLSTQKEKKLIFILGQAAQGKSTLVASYLANLNFKPTWINLSVEDSDPVNLFHSIILSLEFTFRDTDFSALKEYPAISSVPRNEIALYRDWVNSIYSLTTSQIHLVLDGLDRLDNDATSYRLLKILVDEKPLNVQLWILSRTSGPFKIESLIVSQKAIVLLNDDLSFNKKEIKTYFNEARNINLNANQLERVHQLTEGWIGGLILLSDSLDRLASDSREKYLFKDSSSHYKAETFQYFGDEILSDLPDITQNFLILSSIFDIINPKLVNQFLDGEDAGQILNDLVQKNLFVQTIYDEKQGLLYKYHQLFRDFLQSKFNSEFLEKDKLSFLDKAGSLCEINADLENAAKFYLKAKNYKKAEKVVEQIGGKFLMAGRTTDLSKLIQGFPEDIIQNNPWMLLFLSATRRYTKAQENTIILQKALKIFKINNIVRGQLLTLAFLIEATTLRGRDVVPIAILLEEGEALLQTISNERYPWECATLWYQVGFGYTLRGADQRKGFEFCQNAYILSESIGNQILSINALTNSMLALSMMGNFSLAEEISEKAYNIIKHSPYQELAAPFLLNLSQSCTIKGDFAKASDSLIKANEIIEKHGLMYLHPVSLLSELMLKPHLKKFSDAEVAGHQLLQLTSSFNIDFMNGLAEMFLGLSYYLKEDYANALKAIENSCKIVSSDESYSDSHIIWNKILMGLTLYHTGDYNKPQILLYEALDHFKELNSPLIVIVVHLALALLKWKKAEIEQASNHLINGFNIAEEYGFYHFIFINDVDLVKACLLSIEINLTETHGYVSRLLKYRFSRLATKKLKKFIKNSNSQVKNNARDILKSMHRSSLPILNVETLNGFCVSRGDHVITEKEWGGNLPKLFLKIIIARGLKNIPKDLIMEDLWPNEKKETSEANFKANLHRIRKLLEPSPMDKFGSSYIKLKHNLVSLDETLWRFDIIEFEDFKKKAEISKGKGDIKSAITFLNEAVKLYRNDFLSDDLYIEVINSKRESYRQQYIAILNSLAGMFEKRGSLRKSADIYRKILKIDPISETTCQKLMLNFSSRGKRNDAVRLYEEFKKKLKEEVDTEPDLLTSNIYLKILDKGKNAN